jgi:arylsulfatase A-like enzyme
MNRSAGRFSIALVAAVLAMNVISLTTRAADQQAAPGSPDAAPAPVAATKPVRLERPVPQIERAVLISIDGCRPDVLLRAKTPNLRKLIESGSYSFWAKTVPVAVTLPSHASMLTGVLPEKHGITFNGRQKDPELARPKVPTLFEIAMRYDMTTAVVAGKSKFDTFAQVGHVGKSWTKSAKDPEVAKAAAAMIRDYRPDVMLIHFPGCDGAGHGAGWGSPEQVAALELIDEQIATVVNAIDDAGLRDETAILVTSDHGGAGRGHGISSGGLAAPDDPRSQHIPWILVGPGIRKNYDLSQDPTLHIRTMDTFATLCHILGLQHDTPIDGKPIVGAFEQRDQLLLDDKK